MLAFTQFSLIFVLIYTVIIYKNHSVQSNMGVCKLSFSHNALQFNQDNHAYKDFKSPYKSNFLEKLKKKKKWIRPFLYTVSFITWSSIAAVYTEHSWFEQMGIL